MFKKILILFFLVCPLLLNGQKIIHNTFNTESKKSPFYNQNKISIKAILNTDKDKLLIQQEIIFHNTSNRIFKSIFLHNWANSFKDRKTPLSKRLIEDFNKKLYFAKKEELGFTKIKTLALNYQNASFKELKNHPDILKIFLKTPLKPKDSVKITTTYIVKIPNAKFTGYGKTKKGYHLRFWYLTPAIYTNGWQLMSNLNLDDLYENSTTFSIEMDVPKGYVVESNLHQYQTKKGILNNYHLADKNKTDVILSIYKKPHLKIFKTKSIAIHTDLFNKDLNYNLITNILNRELLFIKKYLGKYPHKKIYIDKITRNKNPVYGLNQLPNFLRPFSDTFKWDITMFKALTRKYIENTLLLNKRKDYWLIDGIQNYLMIEYVEKFYPKTKLLGKVASYWVLKNFNLAKLKFSDKYPLVYQFSARKFLDQALTTPSDSLSNFNRKIVNKYKAGLGFMYLKGYLGKKVLNEAIKEFYQKNKLKISYSKKFEQILSLKTTKKTDWFFNDFLKTNKKIDYTISRVTEKKDSLLVTIKNKRNITAPVAFYTLKNKKIQSKKWVTDVDSTKTISIAKGDFNRLSLNYENLYPEYNTLDNWKSLKKKIFNKPLKFTLIKDLQDPYYNQLFYTPDLQYNFYDGVILGVKIHNRPIIERNLKFGISPSYSTKSNSLNGSFYVFYNQYFENTNIYKIAYGISGSNRHYAPNLAYTSFNPFVRLSFKRKSLRETRFKNITAKLVHINKEVAPQTIKKEQDHYNIFSLSYNYGKQDAIKDFRYSFSTEFAKKFSKIATDIRFRSLTSSSTQLDFRFFAGVFLNNKTNGDYFSFGLDKSNDYLFELNYYGRSEVSGIFSQQFIITEGGFKSVLPTRYADQFMSSFNSSIGLWHWIEFYNDVAFLKNKNTPIYFAYENGIRLNFIHNIFEIYFPIYSNNGWEISQNKYPEKIRFTFTGDLNAIYNFFRKGFF